MHQSTAVLAYDQGTGTRNFRPWWLRAVCDRGIIDYYEWLLRRYGISLAQKGSVHGPHITVCRGESPPRAEMWGFNNGAVVEFSYPHEVRRSDYHVWVDCFSDALVETRRALGHPPKPRKYLSDGRVFDQSFHLTVGRLQ